MSDKSYLPEIFPGKATPTIDFTDDPIIQYKCDVPFVIKTLVDDDDM